MKTDVTKPASSPKITILQADLLLLAVALIWGAGFIAQQTAAKTVGFFIFNACCFLIGGLLILPLAIRNGSIHEKNSSSRQPSLLLYSGLTGAVLFAASALQQAGMQYTSVRNVSFITGLYVVFVPLILLVFWRKRPTWFTWLAILASVVGVYLLSMDGALLLTYGDSLVLAGAVLWALHIILIDRFIGYFQVFAFTAGQFLVCGLLNLIFGLALQADTLPMLFSIWGAVAYKSLFAIAGGFTLQVIGQKYAPPTDAAIILSMEAVFGTLFGVLLVGEKMNLQQFFGCVLIFAAMLIVQIRTNQQSVK